MNKVYKVITDRMIKAIEDQKQMPWQKTWTGYGERPYNFDTRNKYNGINFWMCLMLHDQPAHLTFNSVKKLGGKVRKGATSIPILFFKTLMYDNAGKKTDSYADAKDVIPLARYYRVFNQVDIEGIDFPEPTTYEHEEIPSIQAIIDGYDVDIEFNDGDRAYIQSRERIVLPKPEYFRSREEFYSTLFHEIVHWTGHESRLNRPHSHGRKDTYEYQFEELVAEMGEAFLCMKHGIGQKVIDNQESYVLGWLKFLKDDPTVLIQAASQARKAVEYLETTFNPIPA